MDKVVKKYNLKDNQQEIDDRRFWQQQSIEYKIEVLESLREDAIKLGLYPDQDENQHFEEFFALLNKNKVKYLIVGGYAYAIYAEPRFTKDLDIFVQRDPENADRIIKTLHDFGFGSLNLSAEDFLNPDQVIQLGNPPLWIDILTSISGVGFGEAWNNKITGKYGSQSVYFIGKDELRKNKEKSGRKSDLEDLDKLDWCGVGVPLAG